MTATGTQIEWNAVQRLAHYHAQAAEPGLAARERLVEVFRQRARGLEQRGHRQRSNASLVCVAVFGLGKERFGVPLNDLKRVFPRVSITPIPGKHHILLGVANLNGTLHSVVDANAVLNTSASHSEGGYIVLLHAAHRPFALWVDSLEGICEIDLAALLSLNEAASDRTATVVKGITENRILILDSASVISHVTELLSGVDSDPRHLTS